MTKQAIHPYSLRVFVYGAALAGASVGFAQTAATPGETVLPEQTVQMSAFEVRTTQGTGYSEGNTASALKSSSSIMDLPTNILVVSSDMIKDIGQNNASDVLQYAGIGTYYRGPAIMSRGARVGNPYLDDVPLSLPSGISDNADIDAYEVIKGPMQILYPGASLAGIVLQTSKKPLPGITQDIISVQVNQYGGNREIFDVNGPAGQVGDGVLTYRVVGVYQSPHQIFYNVPEQHLSIFPDLEWDWKQTIVLMQYDAQLLYYLPGGTSILTPQGGLYTGDGRRQEGAPPNDEDKNEQHDAHLTWIQKMSSGWENKAQLYYENFRRYGIAAYPGTVNWQTNTVTYVIRLDDEFADVFSFQDDVSGKYNLGPIALQSQFGYSHLDTNAAPDYFPTYNYAIPIGSAAAINSIALPANRSVFPANPTVADSRQENYTDQGYFMETIDAIPNWLTVAGGFTFSKIEQLNDTNIATGVNPYTATDLNGHAFLHRFGAILHLTKDIMLYGQESTTFSGSTGVNYNNIALPLVLGKDDEVGIKTSFLDGRISSTFAAYRMSLTNQAILAQFPALNIAGTNYYLPIGTTKYSGWEGDVAFQIIHGLQVIGAGYDGTVEDQNGSPVTQTYDNQWSVWLRYDFDQSSALKGLAFGGGAVRQGAKYFSMASLTPLGGTPAVKTGALYSGTPDISGTALFKLHEGTMLNLFLSYQVNRHLQLLVSCENVLDEAYPEGAQGVGLVDPSDPANFTLQAIYKF